MEKYRVILLETDSFGVSSFYKDLKASEGFEVVVYPNLWIAYRANISYKGKLIIQTKTALLGLFFKRNRTILLLHGFIGLYEYSYIPFLLKNMFFKVVSNRSEVWSNSYITANINLMLWSIKTQRILYPSQFERKSSTFLKRDIDFLFVGRNTRAKNIALAARVVKEYNVQNGESKKLTVVSNSLPKINDNLIDFRGLVQRGEVLELMIRSKVFISLNTLEPYGIVYEEALAHGCLVVSPVHTGFFEKNYTNPRVIGVASNDPGEIAKDIRNKLN